MPSDAPSNRPRRLLMVTTELGLGGAERTLVNLANQLDRGRFDPQVVSLAPRPAEQRAMLVQRLTDGKVPTHFLDVEHWTQWRRARRRLQSLVERFEPSIVLSFLFHANVLTARAVAGSGCPLAHIAGLRVADPSWLRLRMERHALRRCAKLVAVSQGVAGFYLSRGFPGDRLCVIPNGIDLNRFPMGTQPRSNSPTPPYVLFLGRLHPQKGADRLPGIAEAFLDAVPDWQFWIAGDGPLRKTLTSWADASTAADRIRLLGWSADGDRLISQAGAILIPSRYEGMPNVLLEAMSAAKPVVATPVEGVAELIGEDGAIQVVPSTDSPDFADRLSQIVSQPDFAAQLGTQNRARVESEFDLDRMVVRYEALFSMVSIT